MRQIEHPDELRETLNAARVKGKRVGFVPTMGALHEGHLSLCRASVRANDLTVVSIFVNPLQFGPGEDFDRYPRDLPADRKLLDGACVNFIWTPQVKTFYPQGFSTYVEVEGVSQPLEGQLRPGHFRGVATVVLKLLNSVGPCTAYFGQKDFQQLQVIRKMVQDLNVPTEVVMAPTIREADGLAMSSRNQYLTPAERKAAPAVYAALRGAERAAKAGTLDAAALITAVRERLAREPLLHPDYVALVDSETMQPLEQLDRIAILAVAVRAGSTRIIDNITLTPVGMAEATGQVVG